MSFSQRSQSNLLFSMNEMLWKDVRENWLIVKKRKIENQFPFYQERPCFLLNTGGDLFWQLPHWILFYSNKKVFVVSHKGIMNVHRRRRKRGELKEKRGTRLKRWGVNDSEINMWKLRQSLAASGPLAEGLVGSMWPQRGGASTNPGL